MSETNSQNKIDAEKVFLQQGNQNTQNISMYFGQDPDEEQFKNHSFNNDSPYKGLVTFTSDDSNRFYGRKRLIENLVRDLRTNNLILLLGASGSGKSSLVQAGLIPELAKSSNLIKLSFVPNKDPFMSLYSSVLSLVLSNSQQYEQSDAKFSLISETTTFSERANVLIDIVKNLKRDPDSQWLIFIDQFEEIFTLSSENERNPFIQGLINLIQYLTETQNNFVKIILTMRTDFLDRFNAYPDLEAITQRHIRFVSEMTDRELKLVIMNPAARHGIEVDQDLIELIFGDFRGQSRSLPLLQYTLDLLWKTDDLSGFKLNQKTYTDETFGRVGGALQKQAEKIYQDFEKQSKGEIVEKIFVRLVTITADGKRVSDRQNKSKFTGEMGIVDDLVKKHRLLVAGRQEDMVEIAHEALIGSWQRLQDWITKYEKEIILERQFKEAAQDWEKDKNSVLWPDRRLDQIIKLYKEKFLFHPSPVDIKFINESWEKRQETREKEAKRRQREIASELSLANSLGRYSSVLFDTHKELEAFIEAIKAGKILQKHKSNDPIVISSLQKALYQGCELNRLEGHDAPVMSVSISPDGKILASGSYDKTLKLWNLNTGQEIYTLKGHQHTINSVSFSPNGKLLASSSEDEIIKLWDIETGKEILTLPGNYRFNFRIDFSPDGKMLASGSDDGTIKLWDVKTGKETRTLTGHESYAISLNFSSDGQILASSSRDRDNTIKLWNVETGNEICTLTGHDNSVFSISFSPDGKTLASSSADATIKLWDVETGKETRTLTGHDNSVFSISFSSDGKTLVSGSADNTIKRWDFVSGKEICTLTGHHGWIRSVSISRDGRVLASGSYDKTIKLWNLEPAKDIDTLDGHEHTVNCLSFSPDGKTLASGSYDKTVKLWDVGTKKEVYTLKGHSDIILGICFSPDSRILASGSYDGTIKIWDLEIGEAVNTLEGHNDAVNSVSISPCNKILASGSRDNTIKLWNLETGEESHIISGHDQFVNCVCFSSSDSTLVSSSNDFTIKVWNLETWEEMLCLDSGGRSRSISLSSDGTILAAGVNELIKLWNIETGELICSLDCHYNDRTSVSFSPNSNVLAAGTEDKSIKLWDIKTREVICSFKGNDDFADISFSPDGKTLASGSYDNTIKLWDLDLDSLMAKSCDWVRNYLTHNPNVSESDRHLCDGIGTKQ
jgi:WD40 repeat protein/energy-coupling factor transporter ATP-binding protein EcfA2